MSRAKRVLASAVKLLSAFVHSTSLGSSSSGRGVSKNKLLLGRLEAKRLPSEPLKEKKGSVESLRDDLSYEAIERRMENSTPLESYMQFKKRVDAEMKEYADKYEAGIEEIVTKVRRRVALIAIITAILCFPIGGGGGGGEGGGEGGEGGGGGGEVKS